MADISILEVCEQLVDRPGPNMVRLIEAAASVANAIHVGAGGMIQGTMMEDELRKALGLKKGQLVNIPKR
jgi:hypothetical protein